MPTLLKSEHYVRFFVFVSAVKIFKFLLTKIFACDILYLQGQRTDKSSSPVPIPNTEVKLLVTRAVFLLGGNYETEYL